MDGVSRADQVQADRRDGPGQLHHRDRHPGHHPRPADEEHRQPGAQGKYQTGIFVSAGGANKLLIIDSLFMKF